ncbi:MAG: hypothetical protein ACXWE1_01370 [Thermoanaerobaculia bacterium]
MLSRAIRSRVTAPVAVFALVLALRAASLASLVATPLASWHLWMETDEHAYVEWSARLAAGNWADVPAYRAYFNWQKSYGPPETWERWYQKNAYYAGPLYPYGLAVLRVLFGSPFLPARLLQLLLACAASALLAMAVQRLVGDSLRKGREGSVRVAFWCALVAGVLYGAYGPLVFHDFFLYRDGPVAHVSTLLVAWPLIARGRTEENEEKKEVASNEKDRAAAQGGWSALLLGLFGGLAMLLKQTTAPLALASLYSLSKKSPGGGGGGRSLVFGLLGLAIPLGVLAARNVSAGVPSLTFDTRQAIGLAWGNGFGADATTNPPPGMEEILEEAAGSTSKTAKLVLEGYREAPLQLPTLFLKKLATFFNAYEVPDNANFYFFRDRLGILKVLPVFPCLLGAGVVGLFAARKRGVLRRDELLLAAVGILAPLAACLLVQTTSRYRVGAIGPLALGTGLFAFLTFEEIRGHRTRKALLLAATGGALSFVPLLPSVIPVERHRFSDTLVYATIAEGQDGPAAAAVEVRRYLEEGGDDTRRQVGIAAVRYWAESGDRSSSLVEPSGIAPPGKRLRARK